MYPLSLNTAVHVREALIEHLSKGERVPHESVCEALGVDPLADPHEVLMLTVRTRKIAAARLVDGAWVVDEEGRQNLRLYNACPLCGVNCNYSHKAAE